MLLGDGACGIRIAIRSHALLHRVLEEGSRDSNLGIRL